MQNDFLTLIPEYIPPGIVFCDKSHALTAGCSYFMTKPIKK